MIEKVSKENGSQRKTSQEPANKNAAKPVSRKLTPEEAAAIVRDRLANRPVIVWRYSNGKYNKRFIFTLAIMVVALAAALYYLTR